MPSPVQSSTDPCLWVQDDSRASHDALPERTVIQLDAAPR